MIFGRTILSSTPLFLTPIFTGWVGGMGRGREPGYLLNFVIKLSHNIYYLYSLSRPFYDILFIFPSYFQTFRFKRYLYLLQTILCKRLIQRLAISIISTCSAISQNYITFIMLYLFALYQHDSYCCSIPYYILP